MSARNASDVQAADQLRLKLRLERDRQMRMRSSTFWGRTFRVKRRTESRVDTIRQLLDQYHIRIEGTDSLGCEPADTWLTLTVTDGEPFPSDEWFRLRKNVRFESEPEVEYHFVLPLLEALGYHNDDIAMRRTIQISEGRKRRNVQADIVVFDGPGRDKPVFVIEVKMPSQILTRQAISQAESYAYWIKAPAWLVTNATETRLYHREAGNQSSMPLSFSRAELDTRWSDIILHLSRESMTNHCRQFWS